MFLLVFAQFVARLIVQVLKHADEQVGRIVERLGKLRADVDDGQRIALLGLQFRHFCRIQRTGDVAVLLELRNGDVGRWQLVNQQLKPADVLKVGTGFLVGRFFRFPFEQVPGAAALA